MDKEARIILIYIDSNQNIQLNSYLIERYELKCHSLQQTARHLL